MGVDCGRNVEAIDDLDELSEQLVAIHGHGLSKEVLKAQQMAITLSVAKILKTRGEADDQRIDVAGGCYQ